MKKAHVLYYNLSMNQCLFIQSSWWIC